jgi:hypothetical protein
VLVLTNFDHSHSTVGSRTAPSAAENALFAPEADKGGDWEGDRGLKLELG